MNKLVSIIVPVYNVETFIKECIDSILVQTYKDIEIILVDDGSTDSSSSICDGYKAIDNRIIVVHKKNGGLSDARNTGLNYAKGEYISFIDSDDRVDSTFIETLVKNIQEFDADICACKCYCTDVKSQKNVQNRVVGKSRDIYPLLYSQKTDFPMGAPFKLYRRELWGDFRFPVGKLCEDCFTTYLLIDKANTIVLIYDELYYYRIREESIMTSSFSHKKMDEEEAWRQNYIFMKEHYPDCFQLAYNMYLQRICCLMLSMTNKDKDKYKEDYLRLRKIISSNIRYILFSSKIPKKQAVNMVVRFLFSK